MPLQFSYLPGKRKVCEQLVIRLLYVFRICLFCLSMCPQYDVTHHYATSSMQSTSSFWRFVGQVCVA